MTLDANTHTTLDVQCTANLRLFYTSALELGFCPFGAQLKIQTWQHFLKSAVKMHFMELLTRLL